MRNSAIDTITCELDENIGMVKMGYDAKFNPCVSSSCLTIANTFTILLCDYLISQKVAIGATGFHISM